MKRYTVLSYDGSEYPPMRRFFRNLVDATEYAKYRVKRGFAIQADVIDQHASPVSKSIIFTVSK